jgi:hypothetical protein
LLPVHKQPEGRTAIERIGARLRFLPPYSPDFNPIERAFAKLKAFLRAARPRNCDHVNALVARAPTPLVVRNCDMRSSQDFANFANFAFIPL